METEGEYHVSDQPRPWPNIAKEARDRAAEEAVHGIALLRAIVDDTVSIEYHRGPSEEYRRVAAALACFYQIARLMESVGAQTRP